MSCLATSHYLNQMMVWACITKLTAIWFCRKLLNQWQRSFQLKAALPLANQIAAPSDCCNNTKPRRPSQYKECRLTSIGIPMLRIRRSHDRLIFNMRIPITGKMVFILKWGPHISESKQWFVSFPIISTFISPVTLCIFYPDVFDFITWVFVWVTPCKSRLMNEL